MFDKLQKSIKATENAGAKFVDARYDDLTLRTIIKENGVITNFKTMKRAGVGFNVYYGGVSGYAFSADLSQSALDNAAKKALGIAKASSSVATLKSEYEPTAPTKNVSLDSGFKINR